MHLRFLAALLFLSILAAAIQSGAARKYTCRRSRSFVKLSRRRMAAFYFRKVSDSYMSMTAYKTLCEKRLRGKMIRTTKDFHNMLTFLKREGRNGRNFYVTGLRDTTVNKTVDVETFTPYGVEKSKVDVRKTCTLIDANRDPRKRRRPLTYKKRYLGRPCIIGKSYYKVYYVCTKRC